MPRSICIPALLALLVPSAAAAQGQPPAAQPGKEAEAARPVTDRDVSAADVVATPVTDLNLRKDEIPPLLIAAQDRPYDVTGLSRCAQIASAISELDAVLGEDIDVAQERDRRTSAGRIAQSAIGSFIPFRGLIREISGANAQERKLQTAIYAGSVRRAFLKGVGQQRGCRYPARSATPAVIAARQTAQAKPDPAERTSADQKGDTTFVSRPVVQTTP